MIAASSIPDARSVERPRVLLADDHLAMRALTADALGGECSVVGAVGDGRELLAEAERLHPERVFEKSHAGTIRFSIRRIEARSIIVSEVCTRYS